MEQCLIDNKICSVRNQKCKVCKLDDCKKALIMLEEEEAMKNKTKEDKLKDELRKEYPECVKCSHLQVIDLGRRIVYCPYMINKCIVKGQ